MVEGQVNNRIHASTAIWGGRALPVARRERIDKPFRGPAGMVNLAKQPDSAPSPIELKRVLAPAGLLHDEQPPARIDDVLNRRLRPLAKSRGGILRAKSQQFECAGARLVWTEPDKLAQRLSSVWQRMISDWGKGWSLIGSGAGAIKKAACRD